VLERSLRGEGLPGVRESRSLIGEALAVGEAQARLAVERLALLAAAAALRASAPLRSPSCSRAHGSLLHVA